MAHSIIGGGEEGDNRTIRTKEETDHSLPWMIAVVLLDGRLDPAQCAPSRIVADDVQRLMGKVETTSDAEFSDRFPNEMPADLEVTLRDGTVLRASRSAYKGFRTDPLDWEGARAKFDALTRPFADVELRDEIAEIVRRLDTANTTDLTAALAKVRTIRT